MTRATRLKLVVGFILAAALLGGVTLLAQRSTARLVNNGRWVAHTLEMLAGLEEVFGLLLDAETDQRGFLLTGDGDFLASFEDTARRLEDRAAAVVNRCADNPEQAGRARLLRAAIADRVASMRRTIDLRGRSPEAVPTEVQSGPGRGRMAECRRRIAEMKAAERLLLGERALATERSAQVVAISYAALAVTLLALMGGVYVLVRRDFQEKARVEEALRVSRERYAVAVRGSRDGLWDWDILSGQSFYSPRWKSMLGYEDDELDNNYDQFALLLHPEDRDRAERTIRAYLDGTIDEYEQEIRLRHRDGEYRWILTRGVALRGEDGRPCRMAGSHTDITARKLAEVYLSEQNRRLEAAVASEREAHAELKLAQSRLVQSEKLAGLGQMVAGVAHEINNPLAFVINNAAVLDRDVGDLCRLLALHDEAADLLAREAPDLRTRIDAFREDADVAYTLENLPGLFRRTRDGLTRIEQLVKDLRLFARLDEGDLKEVDLNEGILTTITIIRGNARREDVAIETELGPLPPVACNPAKINQVVMNLLSNAVDAAGRGGTVRVRSAAEPGGVRIAVADDGPGIDPAIMDRIFDPFFTTKPIGQGTGLGLSISYGIIHEHGGSIEVDSPPGGGTTFTVRIPFTATVPADPPSTA